MRKEKIYYGRAVYNHKEIKAVLKVLKKNSLTLIDGKHVKKLEKTVAKIFGKKYGLMVNSGSSANLLALFCLINPYKKNRLKKGDECLVPALCWSTSLWPIIQAGLKPIFVDVDRDTMGLSPLALKKFLVRSI